MSGKAMKPSSPEVEIPRPDSSFEENCNFEGNFKWTNGLLISNQDWVITVSLIIYVSI